MVIPQPFGYQRDRTRYQVIDHLFFLLYLQAPFLNSRHIEQVLHHGIQPLRIGADIV